MPDVVYCKDCEYAVQNCNLYCKLWRAIIDCDFYCAKGKKKEAVQGE